MIRQKLPIFPHVIPFSLRGSITLQARLETLTYAQLHPDSREPQVAIRARESDRLQRLPEAAGMKTEPQPQCCRGCAPGPTTQGRLQSNGIEVHEQ